MADKSYSKFLFYFLLAIIALVVIAGIVALWPGQKNEKEITGLETEKNGYGNPEANIVIIEYSDYQCPACGILAPVLAKIRADYSDQIYFVHRHYPLSYHPQAYGAALAVEAAGRQGKYWEMNDLLFANQQNLGEEDLIKFADKLGLNIEQFKNDLKSDGIIESVEKSIKNGDEAGIIATPTLIINGQEVDSLQFDGKDYDRIKSIIEQY